MRYSTLLLLSVALFVVGSTTACQSRIERMLGEATFHMDALVEILEDNAGQTTAAANRIEEYLEKYRERLMALRLERSELLQSLKPAERAEIEKRLVENTKSQRERIKTLVSTFPDPPRLMIKVREFF